MTTLLIVMSESGDMSMSEQQVLEAKRKVTRARYRKLMEKISENQEALSGEEVAVPDQNNHSLMQFICENNEIFTEVDAPREASMDAVCMRNLSKMCRQRAENMTTNIHEEKSNGSRNAVGEMIPVLFDTRIVIPVSKKGTLKSMTDSLRGRNVNNTGNI